MTPCMTTIKQYDVRSKNADNMVRDRDFGNGNGKGNGNSCKEDLVNIT